MAATPINLPNVAEDPDHGPSPFTDTAQADQAVRTAGEQPGGDVAATLSTCPMWPQNQTRQILNHPQIGTVS